MQTFRFQFQGDRELLVPDGDHAIQCAADIIEGKSYPFPALEPAAVVVDIGAHVGEFTMMASLVWPLATIHAYEPYPMAATVLRHNMQTLTNVVVHEQAVAGEAGSATLYVSGFGTLCNSLVYGRQGADTNRITVSAVGPDAIHSLQPNVLKIDAEGVEWDILQALPVADIHRIYLEFHTERDRQLICDKLDRTHSLAYARILQEQQGELMYVRRQVISWRPTVDT